MLFRSLEIVRNTVVVDGYKHVIVHELLIEDGLEDHVACPRVETRTPSIIVDNHPHVSHSITSSESQSPSIRNVTIEEESDKIGLKIDDTMEVDGDQHMVAREMLADDGFAEQQVTVQQTFFPYDASLIRCHPMSAFITSNVPNTLRCKSKKTVHYS